MSSGSNQERATAQRIINEALKSQSNDLTSLLSDVLGHLRVGKMIAVIDGLLPAVRTGIDEYRSHFIKAAGRAAERAAMVIMVGLLDDDYVTDLNPTPKDNSFPIFDVTSDQRVASVKCKPLSESVDEYLGDFKAAMGMGTRKNEPENFRDAAQLLHERAKTRKRGYPPELAVSPEKAEAYLHDYAELWLPHDHAELVRNTLKAKLLSTDIWTRQNEAETYDLNSRSPTYERDVEALLKRICGIGVDSETIRDALREAGFGINRTPEHT